MYTNMLGIAVQCMYDTVAMHIIIGISQSAKLKLHSNFNNLQKLNDTQIAI